MYSKNLKKIRKTLDLTVSKLAEKIDVPANTISAYERGIRCPSMDFGIQLYQKLNINLNWFISGNGEMFNCESNNTDTREETVQIVLSVLKKEGIIK